MVTGTVTATVPGTVLDMADASHADNGYGDGNGYGFGRGCGSGFIYGSRTGNGYGDYHTDYELRGDGYGYGGWDSTRRSINPSGYGGGPC